jgi:hypothetical protein
LFSLEDVLAYLSGFVGLVRVKRRLAEPDE